ncbi:unnamed protein product, partial [Prorocentrum cordatum]
LAARLAARLGAPPAGEGSWGPPAGAADLAAADRALPCLGRLLPLLASLPCFWALFDQQGSSWVLQARAMDRAGVLPGGWEVSPETIQILNPIFVIVLIPMVARLFERWPRQLGRPPGPLSRINAGMLAAALAFACSAAVQVLVDRSPAGSVPVLLQLPQIFLLTLAEVLVSVQSLDYFYGAAPAEAKSVVTALLFLTNSAGGLLCGLLYQVLSPHFGAAQLLLTFAALMLAVVLLFARATAHAEEADGGGSGRANTAPP